MINRDISLTNLTLFALMDNTTQVYQVLTFYESISNSYRYDQVLNIAQSTDISSICKSPGYSLNV